MTRKIPWFEIVLTIVFLSAYVYAAFSDGYNLPNRWFIRDDAYYYFKVAQNISEGHGSTFDGIHFTNGYHPLWMLVCIPIFALARYDVILPLRVLVLVTGLLQISTALLLYRLVRSAVSPPAAMLAAAYWTFNSYILVFLYKTGVESCIALLLIVLLLFLAHRFERARRAAPLGVRQLVSLGILAALVVFSRLDLIFFALALGIWVILRGSPLRYLLPLDLLALFVSAPVAFILRLGFAGYYEATNAAISMAVVGLFAYIPVFFLAGLYTRPSTWKPLYLLRSIVLSVIIGGVLTAAVLFLATALHLIPPLSRVVLAMHGGFTLGFIVLIRLLAYVFSRAWTSGVKNLVAASPGRPFSIPLRELRSNWMRWLKDSSIYYGIVGGSLSLYMIWNKLAFGSFSPVSGEVKRWWGSFLISVYGSPARTWLSFLAVDANGEFNAWQPATNLLRDWSNYLLNRAGPGNGNLEWQKGFMEILVISFAAVLLILFLRRKAAARSVMQAGLIPLFVGSWLQALSYNVTGYASPKEWYWLTEQVLLVILGVVLINVAFQLVKRWLVTRILMWTLVAASAIWQGAGYWRDAYALHPYGRAHPDAPYASVVPFIEEHTAPGDIIGMTGGGNVAYFIHGRTIVNMDGLINSTEYFQGLKDGTGAEYLYESGMHYIFANPGILRANPYRGQYEGRLLGLASWGGKDLMKFLPVPSE